MLPIAEYVMLADGWRRWAIALGAGACGALAMAPLNVLPAAFLPMVVAVWLIDGAADAGDVGTRPIRRSLARAFVAGWWWGFGFFLAGFYWIGAAFLVDADEFAWALPLGVVALPAGLALFPALGFAVARALWSASLLRVFALATGLGATEWLRGVVLTGFPWNVWGMVLGNNVVTGQLAALVGLHGLTPLVVAIFALPAALPDATRGRTRLLPTAAALLTLAAIAGFGLVRLQTDTGAIVPGIRLRLIQPDVAQDDKFRPENREAILTHYLDLSTRGTGPTAAGLAGVTALVWPESAFPFILSRDPRALSRIAAALPSETVLITGAARLETTHPGGTRHDAYYNAVQVIDHDGSILDSYDKVHLVPFGEYLPLRGWLDALGLRQFVHVPGGFEPGRVRRPIRAPGLPLIAPLICYEAIFPGEVVPPGERPGLLLNVTNDSWFGLTAGPYQHLAAARLRAIEEGLPLVRDANTGISAFIDPYGRILSQLPLGAQGLLDGPLFRPIEPPPAARHPLLPTALICCISAALSVAGRRSV